MKENACQDVILLNRGLRERGTWYCPSWKNETTACVEPPEEYCLIKPAGPKPMPCIRDDFQRQGRKVLFSAGQSYFTVE